MSFFKGIINSLNALVLDSSAIINWLIMKVETQTNIITDLLVKNTTGKKHRHKTSGHGGQRPSPSIYLYVLLAEWLALWTAMQSTRVQFPV